MGSFFFALVIMLVWPWIFLGVFWGPKGIQMSNHATNVVKDHPHATSFVTRIANMVNLIVRNLFSFAIIRFAHQKVMNDKDIIVLDVYLLSAPRYQSWPWDSRILNICSTEPGG